MGNSILSKRSADFNNNGFNKQQVTYIKQKFRMLKDSNGYLDVKKISSEYKCPEKLASSVLSLFDLSSDEQNNQNAEVDEYQFLCSIAVFCNSPITKLSSRIFDIISNRKQGVEEGIDKQSLNYFTETVLQFNRFKQNGKKITDKLYLQKMNDKKFKNANVEKKKNALIDRKQFSDYCLVDQDYKKWMYNMGFITKKQFQNKDQIIDNDYDSDLENQLYRHTEVIDSEVDKIKMGIQHKIDSEKLTTVTNKESVEQAAGDHNWKSEIQKIDWNIKDSSADSVTNPSQNLTLEHAFGYRGFDSRNNLHYNMEGNIVYPTASLGVVTNSISKKQDFIIAHNNDVTCLTVHENLAASGEMGNTPSVLVWETRKDKNSPFLQVVHYLTQGLVGSIGNIAFSPKRKYLAVSCDNQDHNIVIYDLDKLNMAKKDITLEETGVVVSDKSTTQIILAMEFSHDEESLIVATVSNIVIFSFAYKQLKSNRCTFGKFQKSPALSLCLLEEKKYFATGMSNGLIYIWNDFDCVQSLSEHTAPVFSIKTRTDLKKGQKCLISGDKKGIIILWNSKFQKQRQLKVPEITDNPCVVSLSTMKQMILVGTRGCEIFEIDLSRQKDQFTVVMQSHAAKQLKALCIGQPNTVYTGGHDKILFKWQVTDKSKKPVERKKKNYSIQSLDYNYQLELLAVGYSNGVIEFLHPDNLQEGNREALVEHTNPDKDILSLIKFSPDGKFLAVCYTDPQFVVLMFDMIKKVYIAKMPTESKTVSLDFSTNSKVIQLNTEAFDLFYFNFSQIKASKDKKNSIPYIQNTIDVGDQKWMTHSLTMSNTTAGIFTKDTKEDQIICCQTNSSENNRNCLIVGDKYSKLKLYLYPCYQNSAPMFNKYKGHGGQITGIRFTRDEKFLATIGGEDKTLIIWKYDNELIKNKVSKDMALPNEDEHVEEAEYDDFEEQVQKYVEEQENHMKKVKFFDEYQMIEEEDEDAGEQAMSVNPFAAQIVPPTYYEQNQKKVNKLPQEQLKIFHTFGIRTFYLNDEVRNQARFNKQGTKVVYPTAALGVELEVETLKQEFYQGHQDDIVSFAIDDKRQIAATGQMAQLNHVNPKAKIVSIHVWSIEKKKQLKVLNNFHTIAVVLLAFSPDSTLLFSCGNDNQNSYAVYNWKAGAILYSGPVSKAKVNGVFWKNNFQFATCGNDHVKFWTKNKSIQGKIQGEFQQMFSIVSSKQVYISGGMRGNLYSWVGNSGKKVEAHKNKVQTLAVSGNQLFSGSEDGTIIVFSLSDNGDIKTKSILINMRDVLQKKNMRQKQFSILSIDFNPNQKQKDMMLVVTGGCEVLTMNKNGKKVNKLLSGHYKKQLWGLATSPQKDDEFVTTGDDGTIRLWSLKTRRMLEKQMLDDQTTFIRAVDWSSKQDYIVAADSDSRLHLYSSNLKEVRTDPEGQKTYISENAKSKKYPPWVEDIKISPNGNLIAFGAHNKGKTVEIVKINNGKLKQTGKIFTGLSSSILHVDWDKNSSLVSANSQAYELAFFNVVNDNSKSLDMVSASSCKDTEWSTETRKIAFPVRGIFQGVDYSDVKTVCTDKNRKFIAVGYTDQKIRLFKYPAYVPKQVHKEYHGHSSFVTKIKFTKNNYMVSVGGNDKTIIVWKIEGRTAQEKQYEKQSKVGARNQDSQMEEEQGYVLDQIDVPTKAVKDTEESEQVQKDDFTEMQITGDEFMAIKPWLGAIKEPTYQYPEQTEQPPNVKLELEYVYGYRCKDSRQNLFYSSKDQNNVIYHAAAVVINHDIKSNTQKFNTEHTDDILSIAYNKKNNLVLTGQLGPKPLVMLSQDQELLCSWKNAVTKGVLCLSISPSGDKAVCVGMDDDHMVAVIDLKTVNKVICRQKGGKNIILKCEWIDEKSFVTIGIKHYKYWEFSGDKIKSKNGSGAQLMNFVSLAVGNGLILVGAQNNTLTKWKGNSFSNKVILQQNQTQSLNQKQQNQTKLPKSVVQCIVIKDKFIVAGCKDKKIYVLKLDFELINIIDVHKQVGSGKLQINSQCASLRAIDISQDEKSMVIGTLGAQIYEFKFDSRISDSKLKLNKITEIAKGHYSPNSKWTNEVWGLCIDSTDKKRFYTTSDDATVRCWDWQQRKMISVQSLNYGPADENGEFKELQKDKKLNDYVDGAKGRVVAISPEGNRLFVGCKSGVVRIFELDKNKIQYKKLFKKATRQISEIKFHNQIVVIGAHDGHLYVYDYEQDDLRQKFKSLKKHSSYITHFDISRNSCYLQSTCGAYELLFWDIQTGKQLTGGATSLKDERWATWSCTLGWPVQGIWPKYANGTFIHSVDRSNMNMQDTTFKQNTKSSYLLALGNNNGKVIVHNFPCVLKGSGGVEGVGHSSHITNVKWTPDDKRIISAGGQDQCIMQWRVTKLQNKEKGKSKSKSKGKN